MKKVFILLLVFCATSISDFVHVQAQSHRNVVKLDLFALTSRTFCLNYEFVVNDKQSAQVGLAYKIPTKLPGFMVDLAISEGSERDIQINQTKTHSIAFAAEYRFYSGKKKEAPNGFYVAPFLKYKTQGIEIGGSYDHSESNTFDIGADIDIDLNSLGGGVQLGAQWLLGDRVALDWSFFGFGLSRSKLKINFQSADPNEDYLSWKEDVDDFIEDIPFLGSKIDTEASNEEDYIKGTATYLLPTFRSSLSLGIAF